MLKLISLFLIIFILIFIIFYKKKYIFNKFQSKKFSTKHSFYKAKKSKLKRFEFNLNDSELKNIEEFSNFKKTILIKEMFELFKGSKGEKIKALKIAEFLSDKSILPILKIGLKDMDSDIVKVSAKLIQKFK